MFFSSTLRNAAGIAAIALFLLFQPLCVYAQSAIPFNAGRENRSGGFSGSGNSGRSGGSLNIDKGMIYNDSFDVNSVPMNFGKFSDEKIEQIKSEMAEREWGDDESAWNKACSLDSRAGYEKYKARYPNGLHRAEADKRIVDKNVEDALKNEHNALPGLTRVKTDDESPTSVVVVHNCTGLTLTVHYSGSDSKSVKIAPECKESVRLTNGQYGIAVSVQNPNVRPYAGRDALEGGLYEISFYIVSH